MKPVAKKELFDHFEKTGERSRTLVIMEMTHDGNAIVTKHGVGPDILVLTDLAKHQILIEMVGGARVPSKLAT